MPVPLTQRSIPLGQKTVQEKPKWYMVDVSFRTRLTHFIPLSLLKSMASSSDDDPDDALRYIGVDGVKAIKCTRLTSAPA